MAYFSMEFMLSEAFPIYSGGLGNVAGGGKGAAIGVVIGAGGGAGTVIFGDRDRQDLPRGTEFTIMSGGP